MSMMQCQKLKEKDIINNSPKSAHGAKKTKVQRDKKHVENNDQSRKSIVKKHSPETYCTTQKRKSLEIL